MTSTGKKRNLKSVLAIAGAGFFAVMPLGGAAFSAQTTQVAPVNGPDSVADLAAGLLDAVVNISITQNVKPEGDEGSPSGNVPEGAPFSDLFKDFFGGKNGGNQTRKISSLGSGFVIDPQGYVVTNNHVIENAEEIDVIFPNGTKLKAKLIGVDTKTDIALLKVEPKKPLASVRFGDSRKMRIGDWVMAVGNPFGLGGSVSVGIVSARNRNINAGPYDNFIQTDAAINRGNSGGPLFNMQGEVIGINTAIISPSGGSIGIGFSVPTEIAVNVVNQLKEFGETRRGWLGVRIQPVTDEIIESLGLDQTKGAMVSGIIAGSPADSGIFKTGDIIVSFNDQPISQMRDLPRIVAESPIGIPLEVKILRNNKEMTLKVTLSRLKDDGKGSAKQKTSSEVDPQAMPDDPADPPSTNDDAKASDTLGLSLAPLDDAQRQTFGISADVEGVLVLGVTAGSQAAAKGLLKGDVIVEVGQDFIETVDDFAAKITELKESDRRNAYLMIANGKGDLRLVAVPLD